MRYAVRQPKKQIASNLKASLGLSIFFNGLDLLVESEEQSNWFWPVSDLETKSLTESILFNLAV